MLRFWAVAIYTASLVGCTTTGHRVQAPTEATWAKVPPVVDGTCDECAGSARLDLTTAKGAPFGQAFLVHDKHFLYVCLNELQPNRNDQLVRARVASGGTGMLQMDAATVDITVDAAVGRVTVMRPAPGRAASP